MLRTALHLLLVLALAAQGVLPAFAAGRCQQVEDATAAGSGPPCHDADQAPAASGESGGDCCGFDSCECDCLLMPALPGVAPLAGARAAPDAPVPTDDTAPAPSAQAPANPPPIA
jgi:hypothetical protein